MNKLTISAILLSLSVASTAAYACMDNTGNKHQGKKHQGHKQFELMDADNDGAISKEEALNFHEQHFTSMDMDGDGVVTKEEMKAYRQKQRFMKIDTNNDGVISEDEFKSSSKSHKKQASDSKKSDSK